MSRNFVFFILLSFVACTLSPPKMTRNYFKLNFKRYKKLTYQMSICTKTELILGGKQSEVYQMTASGVMTVEPINDSLASVTYLVTKGEIFRRNPGGDCHTHEIDSSIVFGFKNLRPDGSFPKPIDTVNSKNIDYTTYLFRLPKTIHALGEAEADTASWKYQTAYQPVTISGARSIRIVNKYISEHDTIYGFSSSADLKLSKIDSAIARVLETSNTFVGQSNYNKSKGYFVNAKYELNMIFSAMTKPTSEGKEGHPNKTIVNSKSEYVLEKVE